MYVQCVYVIIHVLCGMEWEDNNKNTRITKGVRGRTRTHTKQRDVDKREHSKCARCTWRRKKKMTTQTEQQKQQQQTFIEHIINDLKSFFSECFLFIRSFLLVIFFYPCSTALVSEQTFITSDSRDKLELIQNWEEWKSRRRRRSRRKQIERTRI